MKFGIVMFPTDYAVDPVTLGRAVEERGFDSLFFPEHTHIPASRKTPWPGGAELPREYSHTYDPFVALAAVASATTNLLLGTGICLVIQRDPITLAKEVASLDFLSNGRFLFGVGGGWNVEEMENHGTDFQHRFRLMRERIMAMKEIWTKDEAEYHGKDVDFDPIWSWPKPVQQPHPPIYVGGNGPHTLKRVVDYGDAWLPIPMRSEIPLSDRVRELNEMAEAAGRGRIPVTVYGTLPREEVIGHYADIGVARCIFWLPPAGEAEAITQLDRYAEMMGSFAKAGAS
jgi:probable F420-dependent oxidoreductase